MSPSPKKLFLALAVIILLSAILLARQIKTARSITVKTVDAPLISPFAVDLPTSASDPLLGNPGAPLTIVIFSDLADAETRSLLTTAIAFVENHPTDARLIFKHAPGQHLFGSALRTHEALWCAGTSQPFWALLKNLLTNHRPTDSALIAMAQSAVLDGNQLSACAKLPVTKEAVLSAASVAQKIGITFSPALFINNKLINLDENIDVKQMLTAFIQQ